MPDFNTFWKAKSDRFFQGNSLETSLERNVHFPWCIRELRVKNYNSRCQSAVASLESGKYLGPFAASPCGTGLAVWDRCLTFPRKNDSVIPAYTSTSAYINTDWHSILAGMNNVSVKDGKVVRPHGDFVWDVTGMKNSWDIITFAHILTHKYTGKLTEYGVTHNILAGFLFKICLALRYDLVIDTEPKNAKSREGTLDSFEKRGIRLSICGKFRNPRLIFPCTGPQALIPDRDTMVLVGSVNLEPPPLHDNVVRGRWMEANRWSCLPTITSFVGWQTVDEISLAQLVQYQKNGNLNFEIPVTGLEPPSMFYGCIPESDEGDGKRYFKVLDYLKSDKFKIDKKNAVTLPCKSCLKLLPGVEGYPMKPKGDPSDSKEWKEYFNTLDAVYASCKGATVYYEGRRAGHVTVKKERRQAEANANKMAAIERRIESLKQRAEKLHMNGFLSKSTDLRIQAKQLEDKLRGMQDGIYE